MVEQKLKSRKSVFLTLIAAGVFLVGAALFPLLLRGQENALNQAEFVLAPSILSKAAPTLTLTDVQGKPASLVDYRGKVILVNNWATWCPPCKGEMPELQAYYTKHSQAGFVVVAIESGEPAAEVAAFVKQYGLTFPVWLDPQGAALEAFKNWDLPSSYVVDQDGSMRMSWTGPLNLAALEKYVTPLLGGSSK